MIPSCCLNLLTEINNDNVNKPNVKLIGEQNVIGIKLSYFSLLIYPKNIYLFNFMHGFLEWNIQ